MTSPVILSVEALTPHLSGIGRYTWRLAAGLPEGTLFHHQGRFTSAPSSLLTPDPVFDEPRRGRWRKRWDAWTDADPVRKACAGRVFHGPNFFVPDYADRAVITVHDLSVFKFPETHPTDRIDQFRRDFDRSIRQALHIITDTETVRREVLAFTGLPAERVTAIALAADAAYRPRSPTETDPILVRHGLRAGTYVLCVSTLEPRKNIENLLRAFEALSPSERAGQKLVLAGGAGWRDDSLKAAIAKAAAAGWLQPLGFLPEEDLPHLYAGASVFVYPSAYEGFGLPVVEAMASGVPVLTSDSSCLPEVAGGAALHINPMDHTAFTDALRRLLADADLRATLATKALLRARDYSWADTIRRTRDVYQLAADA